MVLIKIICCTHTMREFYKPNKEFVVDANVDFKCDCQGYGNHTICFVSVANAIKIKCQEQTSLVSTITG